MERAQFHLYLPQMRMSHEAIVDRALAAERSGFDGIAFMDHLAPPLALEQDMWEALSVATWVLARTTTLTVGHLVLCDAFRHPAVLARQVTSLDHASGGRFELGVGWGSMSAELATFGLGSPSAQERIGRLAESLEIMRALWTGEVLDYEGEHFTLVGAMQRPTPTRRIPVTVGGVGPRTRALARAHADWWNVPLHSLGQLDDLRDDTSGVRVSIQVMVALITTEQERQQRTEQARRRFGGTPIFDNLVVGTAEELAGHFAHHHSRGVERFYVWFADFAPVESLEHFAEVIDSVHR